MSKKNLLNESTIRKFMKLASIEPLASDFISKIQEAEEDVEEGMRPSMKKDDELMEAEEEEAPLPTCPGFRENFMLILIDAAGYCVMQFFQPRTQES